MMLKTESVSAAHDSRLPVPCDWQSHRSQLAPDLCVSFRVRAARRCMPVGSLDATNFCVFSRYGGPREECSTHIRHVLIRSADARSAVRFSVGGNMLAVACGKAVFPPVASRHADLAELRKVMDLWPWTLLSFRRGRRCWWRRGEIPFRRYGPHR